jgi:predicted metal-dependent enzyme (double-stranded beta helix superfamily)
VSAPTTTVPALDRWLDSVRAVVDLGAGPAATAAGVRAALARLLTDGDAVADTVAALQAESRRRPARVLAQHVEPDGTFTLQAFRWPPGWRTSIHDHVAWGAAAVVLGAEHECTFRIEPGPEETAVPVARRVVAAGESYAFVPPNDVHQVRTPEPTLSLHVYGADLSASGTSSRRRYPS